MATPSDRRPRKLGRDNRPPIVVIPTDRLELILTRTERDLRARRDWPTPLGISLTLWLVLPISEFKDMFGVQASQWAAVVFVGAILATLWFLLVTIAALRSFSVGDVLSLVCAESDRLDDQRGLYFLHALDEQDTPRLLVYLDQVWDCYLLPHVNVQAWDLSDTTNQGELALYASRLLAVNPDDVEVTVLNALALRSTKYSEFYRREKDYQFEFIHVRLRGAIREDLRRRSFLAGGRQFQWMSVPELRSHAATNLKNGDVLHHMESKFAEFFIRTPSSLNGNQIEGQSKNQEVEDAN